MVNIYTNVPIRNKTGNLGLM